jgi:hypothetical protein
MLLPLSLSCLYLMSLMSLMVCIQYFVHQRSRITPNLSPHTPFPSITPSTPPPPRFPCSFLGSHWEQRLLRDDLMSSTIVSHDAYLSAPTLALFEDSGWYECSCTRCVVLFPGHRPPTTVGSLICPRLETTHTHLSDVVHEKALTTIEGLVPYTATRSLPLVHSATSHTNTIPSLASPIPVPRGPVLTPHLSPITTP